VDLSERVCYCNFHGIYGLNPALRNTRILPYAKILINNLMARVAYNPASNNVYSLCRGGHPPFNLISPPFASSLRCSTLRNNSQRILFSVVPITQVGSSRARAPLFRSSAIDKRSLEPDENVIRKPRREREEDSSTVRNK